MDPAILPGNKPYEPRGGALQLFYCQDDEILFEGPAGTGKTRAVLEKVALIAYKYPKCRILLSRKTRASMTESVLVTLEEKVLPDFSPIKSGPSREHRKLYKFPNGSMIVVCGMDNPDRIMSTEYDVICTFESHELTEDDFEKLTSRLRNSMMPYQQIIADTNPAGPRHWLNLRANKGAMTRVYSRHTDNPTVTEKYLERLRALTGARRARLYEGRWASQEGLVYEFDPVHHFADRFPISRFWRRIRVIDFGYTNPFVCQWWAISPDERAYLYREIYFTKRLVSEHAKQIIRLTGTEDIEVTIADHDAEDRATLEASGITTVPAIKNVTQGIEYVKEMMQVDKTGKPRLFLFRDALVERDQELIDSKKPCCTAEEFDDYSYPKGADGKEMKEAPLKVNDHGMDCTKYVANYIMNPNKPKRAKFKFGSR